ncbi:MAG TPA: hypothetical protein VJN69_11505 [Candidatus Acidoferrales bacterium]|nr:hypothetical protein [Candidatus Acidoferrales bacterium]
MRNVGATRVPSEAETESRESNVDAAGVTREGNGASGKIATATGGAGAAEVADFAAFAAAAGTAGPMWNRSAAMAKTMDKYLPRMMNGRMHG